MSVAHPDLEVVAQSPVDFGEAELVIDSHRPSGRVLLVNGVGQSYVDLEDPAYLAFDYSLWVAAVVDSCAAAGTPIRALHLGGAGMTLTRYVEATRPGSSQVVVEADAKLYEFVAAQLPLPAGAKIDVQLADARQAIEGLPDDEFDLVINDAYQVNLMPGDIAGTTFASHAARVLRPGGLYAVNVTDAANLTLTKIQTATASTAFSDVCIVAAHTSMHQRAFLNSVVAATNRKTGFPVTDVAEAARAHGLELPMIHGDNLTKVISETSPLRD